MGLSTSSESRVFYSQEYVGGAAPETESELIGKTWEQSKSLIEKSGGSVAVVEAGKSHVAVFLRGNSMGPVAEEYAFKNLPLRQEFASNAGDKFAGLRIAEVKSSQVSGYDLIFATFGGGFPDDFEDSYNKFIKEEALVRQFEAQLLKRHREDLESNVPLKNRTFFYDWGDQLQNVSEPLFGRICLAVVPKAQRVVLFGRFSPQWTTYYDGIYQKRGYLHGDQRILSAVDSAGIELRRDKRITISSIECPESLDDIVRAAKEKFIRFAGSNILILPKEEKIFVSGWCTEGKMVPEVINACMHGSRYLVVLGDDISSSSGALFVAEGRGRIADRLS
jgi:hypothetical protein